MFYFVWLLLRGKGTGGRGYDTGKGCPVDMEEGRSVRLQPSHKRRHYWGKLLENLNTEEKKNDVNSR